MNTKILTLVLILSAPLAHAQWSGVVQCNKAKGQPLTAQALGKIVVTKDANEMFKAAFTGSIALGSELGARNGSFLNPVTLSGDVEDGNDQWFTTLTVTDANSEAAKKIKNIVLDLSSYPKGLTTITTLQGNKYLTNCSVVYDPRE